MIIKTKVELTMWKKTDNYDNSKGINQNDQILESSHETQKILEKFNNNSDT